MIFHDTDNSDEVPRVQWWPYTMNLSQETMEYECTRVVARLCYFLLFHYFFGQGGWVENWRIKLISARLEQACWGCACHERTSYFANSALFFSNISEAATILCIAVTYVLKYSTQSSATPNGQCQDLYRTKCVFVLINWYKIWSIYRGAFCTNHQ